MITKLFGLVMVTGSLAVVYFFEGSGADSGAVRLLHWPAMVLTGLGPIGLTFLCVDFTVISRTLGLVFGPSPASRLRSHDKESVALYKLSRAFYTEGPDTFERFRMKGGSPATRKMIERLAVRMPIPDIRELVSKERDRIQIRAVQSLNVAGLGVKLAPSMGMLGTILGMVRLLATLNDPSHIGSHMSVALLTTFFGLFFSLVFWTPVQQKLERVLDIELERYDQCLRWLELLEKRKPADYFAEGAGVHPPQHQPQAKAGAA